MCSESQGGLEAPRRGTLLRLGTKGQDGWRAEKVPRDANP